MTATVAGPAAQQLAARVAAAEPRDFTGHRWLGVELMLLGRYTEAIEQLDRALSLADTERRRLTVWLNLADVYHAQGAADTAETLYRQALGAARVVAPDLVSFAAQQLGRALAEGQRTAEARRLLTEALRCRIAEGDTELIESSVAALRQLPDQR